MTDAAPTLEYAGFWARTGATLLDALLIVCVTYPILFALYGPAYMEKAQHGAAGPADVLITWVLPAVASVIFWLTRQATPGKMAIRARIVDARTGGKMTPRQAIVRYLAYFVALLPLGIGFLWVAFDGRKQGWHDKLAATVVVRDRAARAGRPVRFEKG